MKSRILLLLFINIGFVYSAEAQVQADKQLQMTGGTESDRRITGVGTAADTADAVNALGVQNNRLTFAEATNAGNAFAITLKVSPGAYKAGLMVSFKAPAANTGAVTLNVNNLGAKAVYKNVDQALAANDIAANQVVSVLFDGSAFQVISQLKPASGFTGSLSGDVTGTQNATVISNGAITTDKVRDGAITNAKIAGGIEYSKLIGAPTAMAPSGSASGDLTGSYPAPVIADGAITTSKIGDGTVSTLKIQDGAIISLKLADGSVLTAKIADAAITTAKIADAAVTNTKLADGAVSADKISAGAVTTTHITDGVVTDAKINTVSYSKITGAPTSFTPTGAAGGDLSGGFPNPIIASGAVTTNKIADVAVTDAKIASVSYSKITGAPTALQPTGAASGDLTGTYPNPVIAADAVTANKIADGAVVSSKLSDGAVTASKLNTAGAASGQVLTYNGSNVSWETPATNLTGAASGDLSGMYPAPSIAAGAVTTSKIASAAVTDEKIVSLSYNKITGAPTSLTPSGNAGGDLSGNYPAPVIALGAVTSGKVAAGAITNTHIDAGAAINYSKLNLANSIATTDLANASVTADKIANGAVSTSKVADGAVTDAKIVSVAYNKITGAPTSMQPTGAASGDLTGVYPNPAIAAGVVTTSKIADGAVVSSKISNGAVATAHITDGAVTDEKINTVSYSKITGAPTSFSPTGAAGGDLDGSYPNPVIAANAVTTLKIASGAVTADKINTVGAINGQVLSYNGSSAVWSNPSGATGVAGGDLTGSYPNPAIATGAVTAGKIADGSIANNHISSSANIAYSKLNLSNSIVGPDITADAITTPKIANGAVTTTKISGAGAASGQVLTYNGSSVTWAAITSTPSGAAGGDLSGTYPNPTVGTGTITSAKIADGAITNADVNAAAAIAYSKLNLANSIVSADITNSAVTTGKIKDGAITTAKIQDEAITDAKIADGISYSKLIGVPTSMAPEGAAGGDLSGTYPNPTIATDAVTTIKIADGAITANKLMDGTVSTDKIIAGAVTTDKISTAGASVGQYLMFDGTGVSWASSASAGSGAALQFHGTITTTAAYNSGAKVVFNNPLVNNGEQMNTTTGTFTAAVNGLYQINASLPSTSDATRFLALRVNGVDVFTGSGATAFTAPSPYNATISALSLSVAYPLTAGDQVEVVVYNNGGTATPLTNGSSRLLITKLN